jgi:hypothetical protein
MIILCAVMGFAIWKLAHVVFGWCDCLPTYEIHFDMGCWRNQYYEVHQHNCSYHRKQIRNVK